MSTEAEELKQLRLNKALTKGELQGMAVGGLTGAGLGSLASLGYAAVKGRPLHAATPILGGLGGALVGNLAGMGVGIKRHLDAEKLRKQRGKLKQAAYDPNEFKRIIEEILYGSRSRPSQSTASSNPSVDYAAAKPKSSPITPDEVMPPGAYKSPPKPIGALVPQSMHGTYEKLPESIGAKLKRVFGDMGSGWRAAGEAWKKADKFPYGEGGSYIGKAMDFASDEKPVVGFDLLKNKLKGAKGVPLAGRIGGAARMLAPQVGIAAGTLIPAALLYKAFKEDKK